MRLRKATSAIPFHVLRLLNERPLPLVPLYDAVPNKGYCDLAKFNQTYLAAVRKDGLVIRAHDGLYELTDAGRLKLGEMLLLQQPKLAASPEDPTIAGPRQHATDPGSLTVAPAPSSQREDSHAFLETPSLIGGKTHARVRPASIPSKMRTLARNC